jgi:hypothetical protein
VIETIWEKCFTFCPQHLWYFNQEKVANLAMLAKFSPKVSWTIEPEIHPIINHKFGLQPYEKPPEWILYHYAKVKLPDIIKEHKGYKFVSIFEAI